MSVKVGPTLSPPLQVTGGAVQGSVLGVLDHNAVLNDLDSNLAATNSLYVAKYVDDMTVIETVESDVECIVSNEESKPLHTFQPPKSQHAFDSVKEKAENKNLRLNEEKTQVLPGDPYKRLHFLIGALLH